MLNHRMKKGNVFILSVIILTLMPIRYVNADEIDAAIILTEDDFCLGESESAADESEYVLDEEENLEIKESEPETVQEQETDSASMSVPTESEAAETDTEEAKTDEQETELIEEIAVASVEEMDGEDLPGAISTVASGICGYDGQTWVLSDTGVLTISISDSGIWGGMYNWDEGKAPWYSYRSSIKTVVIETGITTVGENAFYGCTKLESVEMPSSFFAIYENAFRDCTSLKSMIIPTDTDYIGYGAFCGCTSLKSVTIPSSVTSIGSEAFMKCMSLTSVTIPSSVTSIGYSAFYGCTSLTSVTIPSSVTLIDSYTFDQCTNLTEVKIESGVVLIEDYAFFRCLNLKSISIPSSVTSIALSAFDECSALEDVYYKGTEAKWSGISIDSNNEYLINATIHYTYKVKFNANGGSVSKSSKTVTTGLAYGSLPTPTRSGYKFDGWYTKASGGTKVTKNTIVSKVKNHKLYAHWTKLVTQTITGTSSYTKTYKSKGTFTLDAAAIGKLTYTSSDTDVVTVSSAGVVTMKGYGTATITVKAAATGNYDSATRKITVKIKPKKMKITDVSSSSAKELTIQYNKDSLATGYQMQISTTKKFSTAVTASITTSDNSKEKITIRKLTTGDKYYVRIRAYKTIGSKTVYGAWSTVKNVTVS